MAPSPHSWYGICWCSTSSTATKRRMGHFVVIKTNHMFSSIPTDQAHGQNKNNEIVKGDRGAIGLTKSSTQLLRRIVSGPEMSKIINDFDFDQELTRKSQNGQWGIRQGDLRHHKQMRGVQNTSTCMHRWRNRQPLCRQDWDLFVLDTCDIMDSKIGWNSENCRAIRPGTVPGVCYKKAGERTTPLLNTLQRNKLPLFSSPPAAGEKCNDKLKSACT